VPVAHLPASPESIESVTRVLRRVAAEEGGIPGLTPSERRILLGAIPRLAARLAPYLVPRQPGE